MRILFFVLLVFPSTLLAQAKVAFLESRDRKGHLVQLEAGGRFSHVAISYKGKWLHSHPFRGVEIVSSEELQKMGHIAEVVSLAETPELSAEQLKNFLGKPYDKDFSWQDDERFYCSELIAKILGLPPEPMKFSAAAWPVRFQKLRGQPGVSPDGLYRKVKTKAQIKNFCASSLR